MGLAHWLQHADPPVAESTIVIIDPDQFFMDKLEIDGSRSVKGESRPYGEDGILCTAGCRHGLAWGQHVVGLTDVVKKGRPVAQTYGLGGYWVRMHNATKFAGPDSPASTLNMREAEQYFSVGPPLMAHVDDMRKIFPKWVEFMTPVFMNKPGDIQADMYAYSFAAAHHKLNHQMFDQYMVSSPLTSGEAWPFVNKFSSMPCSNPNLGARRPDARIPTFLHVAQRYDSMLTDFMFHKGHVPANILTCELPLIIRPPEDIIDTAPSSEQRHKMYILCNAHTLIREAVLAWKQKHCPNGFNSEERIMLLKKHQRCTKEEQGKTCWDFARIVDSQ